MSRKKTNEEFLIEFNKKGNPSSIIKGKYVNQKTKIKVYCISCESEYEMYPDSLLRGSGCKRCLGINKKTTEEFVYEMSNVNSDIEVLGEYVGNHKHIEIKCKKCGHIWNASPSNLLRKYGCPKCNGGIKKDADLFLEQMKKIHPDIIVLSDYKGANHKIKGKCCRCGNIWETTASQLVNAKSGCPACAHTQTSFWEQTILLLCKEVFGEESVLSRDKTFIKYELDIVVIDENRNPRFAIEPGSWNLHKSKDLLARDIDKRKRCKQRGISLLTIYDSDYDFEVEQTEEIWSFPFSFGRVGAEQLIEVLIRIAKHFEFDVENVDYNKIFSEAHNRSRRRSTRDFENQLLIVNEAIRVVGEYNGSMKPITVECKKCGYVWNPTPQSLLRLRTGCPKCAKVPRKTTESFVNEMCEKGNPDVVVDGEYKNAKTKIAVHCKKCGEDWLAIPDKLLLGRGCPKCRKNRELKRD